MIFPYDPELIIFLFFFLCIVSVINCNQKLLVLLFFHQLVVEPLAGHQRYVSTLLDDLPIPTHHYEISILQGISGIKSEKKSLPELLRDGGPRRRTSFPVGRGPTPLEPPELLRTFEHSTLPSDYRHPRHWSPRPGAVSSDSSQWPWLWISSASVLQTAVLPSALPAYRSPRAN